MAKVLANGIQVEHGLGGMLMFTVTCVDDNRIGILGNFLRRTCQACATNKHVDIHGVNRLNGVCEAFAFHHRARGATHVKRIGAQTLLGQLKRAARACRRLQKQIDDRASAKGGYLFNGTAVNLLKRSRCIQNLRNVVRG